MPYIIETRQHVADHERVVVDALESVGTRVVVGGRPIVSRIAVATLDEAREHVHALGADYGAMAHLDCVLDGTSRMPIGPLPDGTVIKVRSATWTELRDVGYGKGYDEVGRSLGTDQILAAFNAA